ncbi:O-antigen polysaccharide polymerase Wzy [Microbacterium azadirachtae]|uniref:O-antigen polysaccharide polymerase Wzy n=1 Tax=Microbacterium azadirachtae TaxID=582680 RepID=UPI003F74EC99
MDNIISIGIALAAVLWLAVRRHSVSPLLFPTLYFIYFSGGPAMVYYSGGEIYVGTVTEYIPAVLRGFAIALAGWAAADFLFTILRLNQTETSALARSQRALPQWRSWTFNLALVALAAYGAIVGVRVMIGTGLIFNKDVAISVAGSFHYTYMLWASLVLCWTLSGWRSGRGVRALILIAWVVFLFYCLVTGERDFILIAYVLSVHLFLWRGRRRTAFLLALGGILAIFLGSAIFAGRSGKAFTLESVLNQGSTLFVDTFVYRLVDSGESHPVDTWISALVHQYPTVYGPLSQWFSAEFLGTQSRGGAYGFSMTAEGYLNGGYVGIFVLYFILGFVQLWAFNRAWRSASWLALSVSIMYLSIYSIRGELYALVSACFQAVVVAIIFRLGRGRIATVDDDATLLDKGSSLTPGREEGRHG